MRNDKALILRGSDDDGEFETALPWKWEICCSCNGHGTTSRHVECDGGGFTASEWAERDEDFREDYLAGRYDRSCDECRGSGKVKVADYAHMSPDQVTAYERQLDAAYEIAAIDAAAWD